MAYSCGSLSDAALEPTTGEPAASSSGRGTVGKTETAQPPGAAADAPLVINEVACRGSEFVEVVNRGRNPIELGEFAVGAGADPALALPLSGRLAPSEHLSVPLKGLACEDEEAVLFRGKSAIDRVRAPLMPADASFARLPDATGEFALGQPTAGGKNTAHADDAARLFLELEARVPDELPELRITLPAAAVASLRGLTGESPHPWLEGRVSFRDARGTVGPLSTGVRLKGQSVFRDIDGKAAFKLDLDRFQPGNQLFGLEKLTLNNFVQDTSASHERLYYGLLARQHLSAPRVGYVAVFVNDEPYGVYLALEASDEESFLGRSFSSSALLYEGEYGADLYADHVDEFDEDYGSDPERAALRHVISAFGDARDAELMQATQAVIAWDRVVPQLAADVFCGHYDSYTANRNNFTFHLDDDGRLSVISGGADQTFSEVVERSVDGGQLLVRCLKDRACVAAFDAALARIASDARAYLAAGGAEGLRADARRLAEDFAADPRTEWDARELERLVGEMIGFVQAGAAASR